MTTDSPIRQEKRPVRTGADSTIVWSQKLDSEDFLKVPRVLLRIARYDGGLAHRLQPRHMVLLLALAARKFKDLPIRAKWSDLAYDLGTKPDTVRKWAYELKAEGLLDIQRPKARVDGGDRRNKFYLEPLVAKIDVARVRRDEERARLKQMREQGNETP